MITTLQRALPQNMKEVYVMCLPMSINFLLVTMTKAKHFVQGFRCHSSPIVHENLR